jgi:hypothetical protein
MTENPDIIDIKKLSPFAQTLLSIYAKTTGTNNNEKVLEEALFGIFELRKQIDVTRDPKIYPQDAQALMKQIKAVFARFERCGDPMKMLPADLTSSS